MIKGGFQGLDISGVDLTAQSPTLPGAYAACEAAGGKPVRVLTAKGQVTCSIEVYSSNYLLAGVTGEGKILSIVVDGDDGIQVSETEIPSGEEQYTLGSSVDITSNTTSDPYIVPSDGFVRLRNTSANPTANMYTIEMKGSSGAFSLETLPAGSGSYYTVSTFVKKGCKVYYQKSGGSETETGVLQVQFLPLIES